ncbi:MAG: cytochrome c1 [Rhodobacteraceae bacterium]|nr:cytochrome c1 [Paracoccaceae bacterium]
MLRKLSLAAAAALALLAPAAHAAGGEERAITDVAFSFEGPFGRYDTNQLQRGLQVYTEVCAACHGLRYVPLRTLGDAGGPELGADEVRAYAAMLEIEDPATGDFRPRQPTDHFPMSGLDTAPDLSLMAKARVGFEGPYGLLVNPFLRGIGGPEYIASLLTHYTGEEKFEAGTAFYANESFAGGWIAMAPPLFDGQVEFADGSPNDVASMAEDVAAFLMWAAEPKMMARKQAGLTAVLFLVLLSVLLYLTNKRLWAPVKGRSRA